MIHRLRRHPVRHRDRDRSRSSSRSPSRAGSCSGSTACRLPFASGAVWFSVTKTASADYTAEPDKPVFILALGNDGRPGRHLDPRRRDPPHRREPGAAAGHDPRLPPRHRAAHPGPRRGQGQRGARVRRRGAAGPDARQRGRRARCRTRSTPTSTASSAWSTTWAGCRSTCPRPMDDADSGRALPGRAAKISSGAAGARVRPRTVTSSRPATSSAPRTRAT